MATYTIVVAKAGLTFDTLKEFSNFLRMPVVAFSVRDQITHLGESSADVTSLNDEQREELASQLYGLYEMVATPMEVEDPRAFVRERLPKVREALNDVERALAESNADPEALRRLWQATEDLRCEAEEMFFGVLSWDTSQPNAV